MAQVPTARARTEPASPHASSTRCAPRRMGRCRIERRRAAVLGPPASSGRRRKRATVATSRAQRRPSRLAADRTQPSRSEAQERPRASVPLSSQCPRSSQHVTARMVRSRVRRVATPMGDLATSVPDVPREVRISRRSDLRQRQFWPSLPAPTAIARRMLGHAVLGRIRQPRASLPRRPAIARLRCLPGKAAGEGSMDRLSWAVPEAPPCEVSRQGAAYRSGRTPFGPRRQGWRRRVVGIAWVRGSAGPVVRNSVRDNPAQRQVFVGDSRQTSPQRGNTVPLRCYNSMSRCPSGGRGRWGGGGVRGRRRGWRCGRRGVGRR